MQLNEQGRGVFSELGDTLWLWTERLYERLRRDRVEQVFFLSREGQPLKRMFDAYAATAGGGVQSRYLEVSRRATLLASLGPLDSEPFDTLFRQYRAISLLEFLSSLGLEGALASVTDALGLSPDEVRARQNDFPSSPLFARLRQCAAFRMLYEAQRVAQREAFLDYLRDLAGGCPPSTLVVVDVGWKGTIQDNLHALLCAGDAPAVEAVQGFYLGLVAPGSIGPTNRKEGLLFSCLGGRTWGYQVFNENKSLFEIVLAADHGSVVGYARDAKGCGHAVHGPFDEGEMLERAVFPVLRAVERRFHTALATWPAGTATQRAAQIIVGHARMVFRPSQEELAWFDAVFHVENFGLFERSYFADGATQPSLPERLRFLVRVLRRRNVGELGFWPWATLRRRAGRIPAFVYGAIRRWQARRGIHA